LLILIGLMTPRAGAGGLCVDFGYLPSGDAESFMGREFGIVVLLRLTPLRVVGCDVSLARR
jgi:hypothetical protein